MEYKEIVECIKTCMTDRELEVLDLTVNQYTMQQISEKLNLSKQTVNILRHNIFLKLQCCSRIELRTLLLENQIYSCVRNTQSLVWNENKENIYAPPKRLKIG